MNSQYVSQTLINSASYFEINHPKFKAKIAEFGGQLLSYIPTHANELLWLSSTSKLDGSKPIRGGVPLCWPWFGPATADNAGEPQHGYIRSVNWVVKEVIESERSVEVYMQPLLSPDLTKTLGLEVAVKYIFSDSVKIELITHNISHSTKPLSQALHTYVAIDDIHTSHIAGLENTPYIDKLDNSGQKLQQGIVQLSEHTDRVYLTSTESLELSSANRQLIITGTGHDSIVVWNPWQDIAKDMSDFDDNGYINMICIEMANTQQLLLPPNNKHVITQEISIK